MLSSLCNASNPPDMKSLQGIYGKQQSYCESSSFRDPGTHVTENEARKEREENSQQEQASYREPERKSLSKVLHVYRIHTRWTCDAFVMSEEVIPDKTIYSLLKYDLLS